MAKGKAKSKYDFDKETCKHLNNGNWCNLPKFKRCKDVIRCVNGSKACRVHI